MTVRPHPSAARALAQLDRHRSGTPNDVPPEPPTWAESMAALRVAAGPTFAQAVENVRLWQESMRRKQTGYVERTASMSSSASLSPVEPTFSMPWSQP